MTTPGGGRTGSTLKRVTDGIGGYGPELSLSEPSRPDEVDGGYTLLAAEFNTDEFGDERRAARDSYVHRTEGA